MNRVAVGKELGEWTIRVNGCFVISFKNGWWSDTKARADAHELAVRLNYALNRVEETEIEKK
jgi:hypothetical protein